MYVPVSVRFYSRLRQGKRAEPFPPECARFSVFSLPWAAAAAGLLKCRPGSDPIPRVSDAWASPQRFLLALRRWAENTPPRRLPGHYIVGLLQTGSTSLVRELASFGICPDPLLVLRVFARLKGNIFVPSPRMRDERTRFLSALMHHGNTVWVADDPAWRFPSLQEPPWRDLLEQSPDQNPFEPQGISPTDWEDPRDPLLETAFTLKDRYIP